MLVLLWACSTATPTDADSADSAADSGDTGQAEDSGDTGDSVDTAPPFPDLHLGVPAFTTADDPGWESRVNGAAATGGWIAVDVDSGPGEGKDTAWANTFATARAAGVPVVGYVPTQAGLRPDNDVARDIGRYVAWYDLDGVYLDTSDTADCDAAAAVYATHVAVAHDKDADKDAFVVLGVSGAGCESLFALADVFVTTGTGAELEAATDSAWHSAYPVEQFALWATEVPAAEVGTLMQYATDHHYGTVYATDQADEAPWDELPTYWAEEVAAISR